MEYLPMISFDQVVQIVIFIVVIAIVWAIIRAILKLTMKIFTVGCGAILIIGLLLLAVRYLF